MQNSHAQFENYLAEKQNMQHKMMKREAPEKEELEKKDKLAEGERDIEALPNGLTMAENIIKEGSNEVQAQLLKKVLNSDTLTQTNMKISTRFKGKEELSSEIHQLEENSRKLNKKIFQKAK